MEGREGGTTEKKTTKPYTEEEWICEFINMRVFNVKGSI